MQNRFTFVCISCWCVECYKCLYCTFPKEDSPFRQPLFLLNEQSELQRFVLDWEMSSLRNTLFIPPQIHKKYRLRRNKRIFSLLFGMKILKKLDPYSVFRVSRMLDFDQWLKNALNISDNSSIYNYYGTNRVIIVQFATIMQ